MAEIVSSPLSMGDEDAGEEAVVDRNFGKYS